jgi:hypothetical protein
MFHINLVREYISRLGLSCLSIPLTDEAAWLRAPGTPLSVGPAPHTELGPQEPEFKNGVVTINPVDVMMPHGRRMSKKACPIKYVAGCLPLHSSHGSLLLIVLVVRWIKDPFILGRDGKENPIRFYSKSIRR